MMEIRAVGVASFNQSLSVTDAWQAVVGDSGGLRLIAQHRSSNLNNPAKNEPELTFKIGQWIWKPARATTDIRKKSATL